MKKSINWKLYWLLIGMIVISTILGQPAMTKMTGKELTLRYILLYALPINVLSSLVTVYLGLYLAKRMGMGAPIFEALIDKKKLPSEKIRFALIYAPIIGLVVSIATFAVGFIPSAISTDVEVASIVPTAFESFLSAFYGGIFEEITMRLFFMTFYTWLISFFISKISKRKVMPSKIGIWCSILLAGLAFGLGHLLTAAQMFPLTPLVVLKILLGNGISGIVFGYLYWKKGLEASMSAHFTGDIVLHVIPMFFV